MNHFQSGGHRELPRGDQTMTFFGVFTNDRTFVDDSDGHSRGQDCTLVFTLAVNRDLLDADVARVGFMGTDKGDSFELMTPAGSAYRAGIWDLVFPVRRSLAGEEVLHAYAGAFYVETVSGTYYWLKYLGESDFRFDYTSLPTLGSLVPA